MADVQEDLAAAMTDPEEVRVDLTEFTDFNSLPIELRLGIWKLTIPEDRVIAITDRRSRVEQNGVFAGHCAIIAARYTIPGAMQVNREARNELKRFYVYILGPQLGLAVPFNFQHDTLLMDGPDGTGALWSFEKAGRRNTRTKAELAMIHCNLRYLVVTGQRFNARFLNEIQQFTGLDTLILPVNPYWNSPDGIQAFNTRIAQRLMMKWTQWKADGLAPAFPLVPADMGTDYRGRSRYGRSAHPLPYLASVPNYTHHLEPILSDTTDYTRINYGTVITFAKEQELYDMLAGRTVVTLSWINNSNHPAKKNLTNYDFDLKDYPVTIPPGFNGIWVAPPITNAEHNAIISRRRAVQAAWAIHGNTILARGSIALNVSGTFSNASDTTASTSIASVPDSGLAAPGLLSGNINAGQTLTGSSALSGNEPPSVLQGNISTAQGSTVVIGSRTFRSRRNVVTSSSAGRVCDSEEVAVPTSSSSAEENSERRLFTLFGAGTMDDPYSFPDESIEAIESRSIDWAATPILPVSVHKVTVHANDSPPPMSATIVSNNSLGAGSSSTRSHRPGWSAPPIGSIVRNYEQLESTARRGASPPYSLVDPNSSSSRLAGHGWATSAGLLPGRGLAAPAGRLLATPAGFPPGYVKQGTTTTNVSTSSSGPLAGHGWATPPGLLPGRAKQGTPTATSVTNRPFHPHDAVITSSASSSGTSQATSGPLGLVNNNRHRASPTPDYFSTDVRRKRWAIYATYTSSSAVVASTDETSIGNVSICTIWTNPDVPTNFRAERSVQETQPTPKN